MSGGGPLAEVRVLELPGSVATRYCGHLLARLGAAVSHDRDAAGDDEALGHTGAAGVAYGRWLDEGKQPIDAAGALGDATFDVVIAGPDADDVARAASVASASPNARPILLALTWFGVAGPYATWRGSDELVHALSGLAYSFGTPEGPPTLPQGHGPQIMAGTHGANAVMAALLATPERRPRRIDVDVLEAAMCLAEVGAVGALDDPTQRSTRLGVNRYSPTYPCSSYRTSDGWVGVTCLTPAQWLALCTLIGRPELAGEKAYSTSFRRLLRGDEVDAVLEPEIAARTTDEWVALGIAHRIPIAPMASPAALPAQDHWRRRAAFAPVAGTDVVAPTLPFRWTSDGERHARPHTSDGGPLAGIRVVDFSMGWAGPQATRMLGDLGADVVKVESPTHPDWYRGWEADLGGDPPPTELRSNFNTLNRNKRGVALDLTDPAGLAAAKALIATADVVVENFAHAVLEKLGLGQREQRRLRPGLVSLSMPAFGNGGPWSAIRAYGSTVEQASGLPFVNGRADWPPSLQHVAYGDAVAGLYAVTAILAGLSGRATAGGVDLDLAQVACLFELGADAIVAEQVRGAPLERTGNRRARHVLTTVVPGRDADTWLAVVVSDTADRRALLDVVAVDDAGDGARDGLEAALAAWAARRDVREAAELLQRAGVAAAPAQPVHALGHDPHLVATGFWETMQRRYVGEHALGAPAFRFDGRRPAATRPAPTLGEHTAEVLAGLDT